MSAGESGEIRLPRVPAETCLAAAVAASGLILVSLVSELTFITDEWELLLVRRGWTPSDFLEPFHEHIVLAPALVYKVLLAVFGMDSALPFQLVAIGTFLLSAVLLFVYLRPRVGEWAALLAAILILFLGAAFEDLLWAFQIGYFGSVVAGIGVLIVLDRGDRGGDRIACALLVVSLSFSSLGIPFAAGALAQVLLSSRPKVGRLYVALLPIELWGIWWLGWGHEAESDFSLGNFGEMPEYVFDSAAAGIVSLLGLATGDGSEPEQPNLIYGQILLVAGVLAAAVHLRRRGELPVGLLVVLAIALSFWVLTALSKTPERLPTTSRYQFPSAVFLLLIAGEVLRGVRIGPRALMVGAAIALASAWGGMSLMFREHEDRWVPSSDALRSSLGGLEIAGGSGDPAYPVVFSNDISVTLAEYLTAVREHGSPAFSGQELLARPGDRGAYADQTLAEALGLELGARTEGSRPGSCQNVTAEINLSAGAFNLLNEGSDTVEVLAGRYSDGHPVSLGTLAGGGRGSLEILPDADEQPWRLGIPGGGPLRVCEAKASV